MNPSYFVALLFSITIGMYLMGFSPLFFQLMTKYSELDYKIIYTSITNYFSSPTGLLTIIASVATGLVVGGLNLVTAMPIIVSLIMLDLLLFPISYIEGSGLPLEIFILLVAFLKLAQFMVVISFVSNR